MAKKGLVAKQIVRIPVSKLLADTTFMNREELDISDLKDNIAKIGQQVAGIVRPKGSGFEVISGFRRLEAIKQLRLGFFLAEVREDLSDTDAHKISIVENVQRDSLTPLEMVMGCRRMREQGMSSSELAESFGKTQRTIQRWLRVSDAGEEVKQALRAGRISIQQAYQCIVRRIPVEHVAKGRLSVRDMKKLGLKTKNPQAVEVKWFKNGLHLRVRFKKGKHQKGEVIDALMSVIRKLRKL